MDEIESDAEENESDFRNPEVSDGGMTDVGKCNVEGRKTTVRFEADVVSSTCIVGSTDVCLSPLVYSKECVTRSYRDALNASEGMNNLTLLTFCKLCLLFSATNQ